MREVKLKKKKKNINLDIFSSGFFTRTRYQERGMLPSAASCETIAFEIVQITYADAIQW